MIGNLTKKTRMYAVKGTVRGCACWRLEQALAHSLLGWSCYSVMKIWGLVTLMRYKGIFSYFIKLAFPGSLSLIFIVGICSPRESANSSHRTVKSICAREQKEGDRASGTASTATVWQLGLWPPKQCGRPSQGVREGASEQKSLESTS